MDDLAEKIKTLETLVAKIDEIENAIIAAHESLVFLLLTAVEIRDQAEIAHQAAVRTKKLRG
jgi:uncharacterized coiled-coil DUF342 family protein